MNLTELLFMSMSVYTCIFNYIRPVGTYAFTYICRGRCVIVCVLLTCCVIAKPMTGSPSGMSHVTTAEFAFTALMVTLTGGDKLSADTQREKQKACFIFCRINQMRRSAPLCFCRSADTATRMAGSQVQQGE